MSEEQLRQQIQDLRAKVERGEVHLERNLAWLEKLEHLLRSLDASLQKLVKLEEAQSHMAVDQRRFERDLEREATIRARADAKMAEALSTLSDQGASTGRWSRFTEGMVEKIAGPVISSAIMGGLLYLALAKGVL